MFDFSDFGDMSSMYGMAQRNRMSQQMQAQQQQAAQQHAEQQRFAQQQVEFQRQQRDIAQATRDDQQAEFERIRNKEQVAVNARKSIASVDIMLQQLKIKYG